MLELFNKTDRVKVLPKYNYEGQIRLAPSGTYSIEDYMKEFYKPYESIGITLRGSVESVQTEPEVKKVVESESVSEEIKKEDNTSDTKVEEVEDNKSEVKVYEKSELQDMKIDQMKDILKGRGVNTSKIPYKKAEYIKAIIDSQ